MRIKIDLISQVVQLVRVGVEIGCLWDADPHSTQKAKFLLGVLLG